MYALFKVLFQVLLLAYTMLIVVPRPQFILVQVTRTKHHVVHSVLNMCRIHLPSQYWCWLDVQRRYTTQN
jgi:hypothetical protein